MGAINESNVGERKGLWAHSQYTQTPINKYAPRVAPSVWGNEGHQFTPQAKVVQLYILPPYVSLPSIGGPFTPCSGMALENLS